ncbi:MAG: c-type cytochrome [Syntrophaceae bacterium]|nr:c-type cytochrome [Syntrophaceae bacterium]
MKTFWHPSLRIIFCLILVLWVYPIVFDGEILAEEKVEITPGEKIYREHCLRCHGELGRGGQGNFGTKNPASRMIPSLNTGAMKLALTTDKFGDVLNRKTIKEFILKGSKVEGTESTLSQPAFKEKLTEAQVDQVLDYVATLPDMRPIRYTIPRLLFLGGFWIFLGLVVWSIQTKKKILNSVDFPKIPIDQLDQLRLMELDACTSCGECVTWCPVYLQDEKEAITPRKKIADFRELIKAQYSPNAVFFDCNPVDPESIKDFAKSLYECSTCGQCHFVCPSRIDTVELWEKIRRCIVDLGFGPLENQIPLVKNTKAYDNPWGQPRSSRAHWARAGKKDKTLLMPPKEIKEGTDILYFVGCTASFDANLREIAINTTNIMNALGLSWGYLGNQEKCCGSVLLRMGDKEFERIASENIKMFNELGIKTLVTSCAGCFKTIKQDYPKVGELNFEVIPFATLLSRLIEEEKIKFNKKLDLKVTYHDPCHMGRASGEYDDPRKVLEALSEAGVEFVEMERNRENSRCCGAGGGLKSGYPQVQQKMTVERVKDAERTGSTDLISTCPFCYQGLQKEIITMGSSIRMRDLVELVALAMGLPSTRINKEETKEN